MKISLLIIANELLNGKIQDKNIQPLAKKLQVLGHKLQEIRVSGDDKKDILSALRSMSETSELIITSGGLGPTQDDITKHALIDFFQTPLVESQTFYQTVLKQFNRQQKDYCRQSRNYHMASELFIPVYNPLGLAPGIMAKNEKINVISLPGVPSEFKAMLNGPEVESAICTSEKRIGHFIVRTWKVPEAKIFFSLCPNLWKELETYGEVSSLPHHFGVDIGVELLSNSKDEERLKIDRLTTIIESSKLKDYVWSYGNKPLEEVIIQRALEKKLTLGFAESCTGGLCSHRLTKVSGSSQIFWGGIVSYDNSVKEKQLGVKAQTLASYGAVSQQTAIEMAMGAKNHLQVDIAVSTTGIAGPGGGSKEKPVGTIAIGYSSKNGSNGEVHHLSGDRAILQEKFSDLALVKTLEEIMIFGT